MFLIIFSVLTLINVAASQLSVYDKCVSANGRQGTCKLIISCPHAAWALDTSGFHNEFRCGFYGLSEIVCCEDEITVINVPSNTTPKVAVSTSPKATKIDMAPRVPEVTQSTEPLHTFPSYLTSTTTVRSPSKAMYLNDPCITPQGEAGICKFMTQCPVASNSVQSKGYHDLKRCGFEGLEEIVCCVENVGDRFAINGVGPSTRRPSTRPPTARPPSSQQSPPARPAPTVRPDNSVNPLVPMKQDSPGRAEADTHSINSAGFGKNEEMETNRAPVLRKADAECQKLVKSLSAPTDMFILGGTQTLIGEFPHMAAVGYIKEDKEQVIQFLCGGTLISPTFVLTASHCLDAKNLRDKRPVLVRLGIVEIGPKVVSENNDYNIKRIIMHPQYKRYYNDIALLELVRPVIFSDNLHPACLHTKTELKETAAIVTGWGATSIESGLSNTVLLKTKLTIVNNTDCEKHYYNIRLLNRGIIDNMLCAGDDTGHDACKGDSGGPLQATTEDDGHYRIIGVVSFGVSCGTKVPGVYTRVASYVDWIEAIVWPSTNVTAN